MLSYYEGPEEEQSVPQGTGLKWTGDLRQALVDEGGSLVVAEELEAPGANARHMFTLTFQDKVLIVGTDKDAPLTEIAELKQWVEFIRAHHLFFTTNRERNDPPTETG